MYLNTLRLSTIREMKTRIERSVFYAGEKAWVVEFRNSE
jgi:hypothetical protein